MNAPLQIDPASLETEPDPLEMNGLLSRLKRGINGQVFRMFGNKVLSGPFAGMLIPERNPFWDDGNSSTKLLGIYEFELHKAFEQAGWRRPRIVVNVGCAEGYYTIGLARGLPKAFVFGFDTHMETLGLCKEYSELNKVQDRIHLEYGCLTPEAMSLRLSSKINQHQHRLYVIDCEGSELDLINLQRCPELVNADLIIECHDCMRPDTSAEIADRLYKTHSVELVRPRLPDDLERFQFLKAFPVIMSVLMAVEIRPMPCYWLVCWANQKGISDG